MELRFALVSGVRLVRFRFVVCFVRNTVGAKQISSNENNGILSLSAGNETNKQRNYGVVFFFFCALFICFSFSGSVSNFRRAVRARFVSK